MRKILGSIDFLSNRKTSPFRARRMVNGKRYQQHFATRAQAEAWLVEQQLHYTNNTLDIAAAARELTLEAAFDRYERENENTNFRNGQGKKLDMVRRHLDPAILKRPISEVLTRHLVAYREARLAVQPDGTQLRPGTVAKEISAISVVFRAARVDWGYDTVINPVVRGVSPTVGWTKVNRRIPQEHLDIIVPASRHYEWSQNAKVRMSYVVRIAVETCMRQGELGRLDWADVHLDRRVVLLHDTKNGDPREVPLTDEAIHWFQQMGPQSHGRVFGGDGAAIRQAWLRVMHLTGFKHRFHDLRHEAISRFVSRADIYGLSTIELMLVTGHKTVEMLNRYSHLMGEGVARKLQRGATAAKPRTTLAPKQARSVVEWLANSDHNDAPLALQLIMKIAMQNEGRSGSCEPPALPAL